MRDKVFGHSLIIGILLLTVASVTSLFLIFSLENEVKQRNIALKAQHRAGDIDRALMEWMIYRLIAETSQEKEPDSELANTLQKKVLLIQKDLERSVLHDPSQLRRSFELKQSWTHFIENLDDPNSRIELQNLIREIENYEQSKIDKYSPTINYKIKIMTLASMMLLLASLIIVVHSFKNLKRKKKQQEEIISKLEQAKRSADESSQLKSKFVTTVSHEIRTPINGIVGATEAFEGSNLSDTQKRLLKVIHYSSKTLLNLVNELLDFSKLEAKKITLKTKALDLYDFITQVTESMSWKAEDKGLQLNSDIDFDVPQFVLADENLLRQVLINLVGNALKFTDKGRVILKVQMENQKIRFSVEDTGVGISEMELNKIFTPFFQSDSSGTSNEPGTGIGLTISQKLIEAMGGKIQVQSVLKKGTRFYFSIPLKAVDKIEYQKSNNNKLGFKNALQGFRVLVAEDNPTNQLVCEHILKNQGAKTVLVNNGLEAVERFKAEEFDLVLLDCQMPLMDGYEAAKEIRQLDNQIGIVALTANVSEENRKKCLSSGMNGFIGKPLSSPDLVKVISEINPKVKTRVSSYNLKDHLGEEAQRRVLKSYVNTLKDLEIKLQQSKNLNELKQLGHQFKSSSKLVGEHEFSELCFDLENSSDKQEAFAMVHHIQSKIPEIISRNA